jgi:predicted MFS family arabinose efflux permease
MALKRAAFATRAAFFAAGFGASCWAPLVPFAKARLGIDDASLGLLLLCLGAGSVVAMPLVGTLSSRIGSKPIVLAAGVCLSIFLPLLVSLKTLAAVAVALLCFGASLGAIDVAMNLQAAEVERRAARPLMSGFHALFSVGGFAGSGLMTAMLSNRVSPQASAIAGAVAVLLLAVLSWPFLLSNKSDSPGPLFVLPRGFVMLLAALAFISFLVEGALLDWSALLLVSRRLVLAARGGIGYMLFSVAMTAARLTGDRVVAALGERRVLLFGSATATGGFCLLLVPSYTPLALAGFVFIGLGAANIVPILFRRAANQQQMPSGLALAAVTGAGYAGVLAGPALIGFVAHAFSLYFAFWLLAGLLTLIALFSKSASQAHISGPMVTATEGKSSGDPLS